LLSPLSQPIFFFFFFSVLLCRHLWWEFEVCKEALPNLSHFLDSAGDRKKPNLSLQELIRIQSPNSSLFFYFFIQLPFSFQNLFKSLPSFLPSPSRTSSGILPLIFRHPLAISKISAHYVRKKPSTSGSKGDDSSQFASELTVILINACSLGLRQIEGFLISVNFVVRKDNSFPLPLPLYFFCRKRSG